MVSNIFFHCISRADLGDWVDALPPQRFDPLPTQSVSLCADPTNIVEAVLAPLDTNFEVGAHVKKRDAIFGKNGVRSMQYLKSQIFRFCFFYCFKNLRVANSKFQLKFQFKFYLLI